MPASKSYLTLLLFSVLLCRVTFFSPSKLYPSYPSDNKHHLLLDNLESRQRTERQKEGQWGQTQRRKPMTSMTGTSCSELSELVFLSFNALLAYTTKTSVQDRDYCLWRQEGYFHPLCHLQSVDRRGPQSESCLTVEKPLFSI